MRELFGKVPCEEELAMIHSEPLEERCRSQIMLQEDSQVLLMEASTLDTHKPCVIAVWLYASLWSGRCGLCQVSVHLSRVVGIAALI